MLETFGSFAVARGSFSDADGLCGPFDARFCCCYCWRIRDSANPRLAKAGRRGWVSDKNTARWLDLENVQDEDCGPVLSNEPDWLDELSCELRAVPPRTSATGNAESDRQEELRARAREQWLKMLKMTRKASAWMSVTRQRDLLLALQRGGFAHGVCGEDCASRERSPLLEQIAQQLAQLERAVARDELSRAQRKSAREALLGANGNVKELSASSKADDGRLAYTTASLPLSLSLSRFFPLSPFDVGLVTESRFWRRVSRKRERETRETVCELLSARSLKTASHLCVRKSRKARKGRRPAAARRKSRSRKRSRERSKTAQTAVTHRSSRSQRTERASRVVRRTASNSYM